MKNSKPDSKKWSKGFTEAQAKGMIPEPQEPVPGFPMRYLWHTGPWFDIFEKQIELIASDIRRAKAEGKLVVYLSCPISSRGGGYSGTNVDIAKHAERTLLQRWGEGFWILNPAQYQLESKAGTGLMNRHAEQLGIDIALLRKQAAPAGGDYMRMWTRVLVENGGRVGERDIAGALLNTGQYFDAYYFLGPKDVQSFFLAEGDSLTAGVQAYFARKYATDADFRAKFRKPLDWDELSRCNQKGEEFKDKDGALRDWTLLRSDFLRYYGLRASANFSLGSHDEWLIFSHLNRLRREATRNPAKFMADGDAGEQIAGFFDGNQVDPASTEIPLSRGYSC
ncbi:MAG: hypothetical protein A2514_15045 [Gammaproteobacteria bacterium RIFOXYD12_FULL_61_37]|nr:MAG: hypothetical protein A2514_15045 [Gammaproteobacteria bacterium RIFOXYD12_FULL_61_37]